MEELKRRLCKVVVFVLRLLGITLAVGCGDEDTPNSDSGISKTEEIAGFLETEINKELLRAASLSVVDELTRLLDSFDEPDKRVLATAELDAFFSDGEKSLAFVAEIREHPAILRRVFSIFSVSPELSDSGSSILVRIAQNCHFPEARTFLEACQSAQSQNLRSKAALAKAIFSFRQCEAAWLVQSNPIPMDPEILTEIEWCFSNEIIESLSQLDIPIQRREASILAARIISESGNESYTAFESVAEYGQKKLAYYSSVGADTQLTDLIEKSSTLQSDASIAESKGLKLVVIQFEHSNREPEEVSFIKTIGELADFPDLRLVWISNRQMDELQKSLPNETMPASLRYIFDEDGETWRSVGSSYVCLTCVYDRNGVLRFRGHGYKSAESIRKAVTIVGEAR